MYKQGVFCCCWKQPLLVRSSCTSGWSLVGWMIPGQIDEQGFDWLSLLLPEDSPPDTPSTLFCQLHWLRPLSTLNYPAEYLHTSYAVVTAPRCCHMSSEQALCDTVLYISISHSRLFRWYFPLRLLPPLCNSTVPCPAFWPSRTTVFGLSLDQNTGFPMKASWSFLHLWF